MPAPVIPNVQAPLAAVLCDPVTGNFYGGASALVASALNIPNRTAPTAVVPVSTTTIGQTS